MICELNEIDLADAGIYLAEDGGMGVLKRLQREAPVYWNQRPNRPSFWALTRHRDGVAVHRDTGSFTSERGMQVGQDEAAAKAAAGKMLIVTDRLRHRQLREVMDRSLRPGVVARLEATMERTVEESLAEVAGEDSFDFVAAVAGRLPQAITCELLGVPRPDWPLMIQWTRTAFGSAMTEQPISDAERTEANANIFCYFTDLLAERRRRLGDDLVSDLAAATIDGEPLSDEEVVLNINGLITGGHETTRHASAGAVIALIQNPDEWRRLQEDPGLAPTAAEEVLRWTAPSLNVMRTALRDVTVGGQRVRTGERVSIWNPVVNRDDEAFPDADRFDVGRTPNRHLTFGLGQHFCIGAALARLELRALLLVLTRRVRQMELAGPIKRLRSNLMWGVDRVPVRFAMEDAP
jgi:cytochrome P450